MPIIAPLSLLIIIKGGSNEIKLMGLWRVQFQMTLAFKLIIYVIKKLGHPSYGTIVRMLKSTRVSLSSVNKASIFCKFYQLTKTYILPFMSTLDRVSRILFCCILTCGHHLNHHKIINYIFYL